MVELSLISFRPLTGIICETAYHEVGHLFSPPDGDIINHVSELPKWSMLSPPYGDHTKAINTQFK